MKKPAFDPARRRFLRNALVSGMCFGSGLLPNPLGATPASAFPALKQRRLVNIFLNGGPDFRHLMPAAFSRSTGSYGRTFWEHRAAAFSLDDNNLLSGLDALEQHWDDTYTPASHGSTEFGIRSNCGWLIRQWEAGNVAVVCNVHGSASRDHEHSIRIMELGDTDAGKYDDGSGWGGRLAHASGANVVALTYSPKRFTFGPDPASPANLRKSSLDGLITIGDSRRISLFTLDDNDDWHSPHERVASSLKGYYRSKRQAVKRSSPYHRFLEHENKLRIFGDAIDERLNSIPVPDRLAEITDYNSSPVRADLGLQARNLHDALLCADILDMRVASMAFGGWDTHDKQTDHIEHMLDDLFSDDGALARLDESLPGRVKEKQVYVIAGEFGRQLAANGGLGTDHGYGNSVLLIGEGVRGGIYGDMFPNAELARYGKLSSDIDGLTAFDHVFGAACEWTKKGSQDLVFPNRAGKALETGVKPTRLFT